MIGFFLVFLLNHFLLFVIGVFVLPFSQTSLVMVTLKAHGFNKNYS